MMDSATATRRGTRRRAIPMMAGGLAALAGMYSLVSANVLAVNFTTMNTAMQVNTNYITGLSGAGYLDTQTKQDGSAGVAEIGFKTAKLSGLCALADQQMLGVDYTVMIMAGAPVADPLATPGDTNVTTDGAGNAINLKGGDGADAGDLADDQTIPNVTASNLFLSAAGLTGYGNKISGLYLGENATAVKNHAGFDSSVTDPIFGGTATAGAFGLEADHLNVSGTSASSYGINLQGQITLPRLKIKVLSGTASSNRSACDTQATS